MYAERHGQRMAEPIPATAACTCQPDLPTTSPIIEGMASADTQVTISISYDNPSARCIISYPNV